MAAARLAGVVFTFLAFAGPAAAATYYVSPSGDDAAAGTAPATAWRTISRTNRETFRPGDTVLFQGGTTFTDATLMPVGSGTAGAPITFSSYGSGQATISNGGGAVWLSGVHWLVFSNLALTTNGSSSGVFAGAGSAASTNITLADSTVSNTAGVGVMAPNAADADWMIERTAISHTGDSGLLLLGSGHTVTHDTITDTGWNNAIAWGKHGIYSKGPDQTISYNDISNDQNGQAISIRFHGARVFENTIHDTAAAIGFFDYDTAPAPQGTSYVYDNRFWNISNWGFYYDNVADPNGHAPSVDFVLASNTWQFVGATEAINASLSGSAKVTLVNNIFTGSYYTGLRSSPSTVENHNLWFGAASNVPTGLGDLQVSPRLSPAPGLAPAAGSPAIDAGNTAIGYSASCDGSALSYCGAAPDLGAVESALPAQRVPALAPLPVPAPAAGPAIGVLRVGTASTAVVPASLRRASFSAPVVVHVRLGSPAQHVEIPAGKWLTLAALTRSGVRPVLFALDGRTICVAARAPYACSSLMHPGNHRMIVHGSGAATVVQLTVSPGSVRK